MRVLVTGGAGFIGSAVTRMLVARGDEVLVFDKLTYAGNLSSLASVTDAPNFTFMQGDICDAVRVAEAFNSFLPDAVMHLAAESHVDRSITGAEDFVQTNVVGTLALLQKARAYRDRLKGARGDAFRFLHVSTDEVFGSLGADGHFSETTPYDPRSPYAASKAASDHLVKAWGHTYELPVLLTNCSNNYGPYHLPEKLIPLAILNAIDGRLLPVYGDGANVRDWLYVDDHAAALALVLEKGVVGRTYNIGGRNERSNLAVVERICDLLDARRPALRPRRALIAFVPDRPGHDQRYSIDPTRIEAEIGWRARETFDTGLARTVDWYLSNEAWWRPLREAGHGYTRLGLPS